MMYDSPRHALEGFVPLNEQQRHAKEYLSAAIGMYEAMKEGVGIRIADLEAENERLRERHADIVGELYGQGFEVAGWHQNGDLQPLDSWFEDNDWTTASRRGRRG